MEKRVNCYKTTDSIKLDAITSANRSAQIGQPQYEVFSDAVKTCDEVNNACENCKSLGKMINMGNPSKCLIEKEKRILRKKNFNFVIGIAEKN